MAKAATDHFIRLSDGIIDLASVCGITLDGTIVTIVWGGGSRTVIDSERRDPDGYSLGRRAEDERSARSLFEALSKRLEAHRLAIAALE